MKEIEVKEWLLSDQTFEKLGEMWLKMLGLYDEQNKLAVTSQVVQWHEGSTGHAQIHEAVETL